MKKAISGLLCISFIIISGCSKVPITGRKQFSLVSDTELRQAAFQQYDQFLAQSTVVTGTQNAQMVNTVGDRLSAATSTYLQNNGYEDLIEGFQWEYHLIEQNEANAWCMPGGKIAVYTGILPITQDEKGLAVVMGHEIAHAVAQHGNERMSQLLAAELGGMALSVAIGQKPQQVQDLLMIAYGVTTNLAVILPYSRKHETEADKLGLVFMALAGYDPTVAVPFWERMATQSGGGGTPELLSTHPAYDTRIKNIRNYMNTALKYYKPAQN